MTSKNTRETKTRLNIPFLRDILPLIRHSSAPPQARRRAIETYFKLIRPKTHGMRKLLTVHPISSR